MAQSDIRIIKDDHSKFDKITNELMSFKNSHVKVGVLEGTGRKPKTGQKGRPDITMAMIAAVHEYGSPKRNIRERSFIRSWVAGKKSEINAFILSLAHKVDDGKLTCEEALKKLGTYGVGGIRQKIRNGPFEPLKEKTKARKHSSKPLIDTGQLVNSIHYKVEKR